MPWEDAALQEGHFDQHRQIALIDRLLNSRRASGYPLTRLVGNMEWALEDKPGGNDMVEYESRINYTLDKYDDAVCCTYDVCRFSASVIMDALRRSLEGGRAAAPRGQRRASAKRAPAAARKTRAVASRKRKAS